MPIDYKKTEKELYQPKTKPSIIDYAAHCPRSIPIFLCCQRKSNTLNAEMFLPRGFWIRLTAPQT